MQSNIPLAERLRPRTLDEYIGQEHLVGPQGVFRKFIETGNVPSFILWGPPGVGKTTLAKLVATALERKLFTLSAVTSGVKEVREVIEQARKSQFFNTPCAVPVHRRNPPVQQIAAGFAARRRRTGCRHADRRDDRKPVVRGDLAAACRVARSMCSRRWRTADLQRLLERAVTTDPTLRERGVEVRRDRSAVPLQRGRRPQAAQHPRHPQQRYRRRDRHQRQERHRLPATKHRALRQERRTALRRNLGFHQVGARQRPERRNLLPRADARRRRRPEVHRPAPGDPRRRRHRAGQSERTAAGERLLRHRTQNRHARGAHSAGRSDDLPGDESQEQFGLYGDRTRRSEWSTTIPPTVPYRCTSAMRRPN